MSVIVKGMKMPKNCESCPCKTADAFGGLGCQATGYIPLRKVNQDRPDWCPLGELPTPHGDLIDSDALKASLRESIALCYEWVKRMKKSRKYVMTIKAEQSLGTFEECYHRVKSAPTIIEAEE